jgi:hypothetical protein
MTQDLVVTCTAYVQDDSPAKDDSHRRKGMVPTEELRRIPAGRVPILIKYGVKFPTALFPQLQLCHIYWLVTAQPVRKLLS